MTKRSNVANYLNSTPSLTSDAWELVGEGIASAQLAMNPQTSVEQFVHEDVATGYVDGYQPDFPVDQIVSPGDDLFDYIDAIRQAGPSIGDDDLTEFVEARLYEAPATDGTTYPATKWNVGVVVVNAPGGDGGGRASLSWSLVFKGEPTDGDFDTDSLAFTPT